MGNCEKCIFNAKTRKLMSQLIEKVVSQIVQNQETIKCEEPGEIYDLEKFYSGYA
jgi:hypothetical protein